MLAALLALVAFPWPCPDATACALAWDPSPELDLARYEVRRGAVVCDQLPGRIGPRGRRIPPRALWWPRSTPTCPAVEGASSTYDVVACDTGGLCSASSGIEWTTQPMTCLRAAGCEDPCWPGAPRHRYDLPACGG